MNCPKCKTEMSILPNIKLNEQCELEGYINVYTKRKIATP